MEVNSDHIPVDMAPYVESASECGRLSPLVGSSKT